MNVLGKVTVVWIAGGFSGTTDLLVTEKLPKECIMFGGKYFEPRKAMLVLGMCSQTKGKKCAFSLCLNTFANEYYRREE
jgi:hypothetical protein